MNTVYYFDKPDAPGIEVTARQWQQENPQGACFALLAESDAESIPDLQGRFQKMNFRLLGAVFPELVVDADFKSSGVLLMQLKYLPYYELIADLPTDETELDAVINEFANNVKARLPDGTNDNALMLLFDAMLPNIGSALERLYLYLSNSVHYFGINAGSETFQPMPCLFDNEHFFGNGMLALLLPNHPGAVLSHNYRQPDIEMTATSTEGNCINSIDWRPAFEVYQELVKNQYNVEITAENFYEYGVHFPFGISRMDGESLVRIPVALQDDGSLFCVGEVPPNTLLSLMDAIPPGSTDSIDIIARQPQLNNIEVIVIFYCAGRRMHLAGHAQKELHALRERMQPVRIAGALSLGEIGSSVAGGYPLFHNATLVAAPW